MLLLAKKWCACYVVPIRETEQVWRGVAKKNSRLDGGGRQKWTRSRGSVGHCYFPHLTTSSQRRSTQVLQQTREDVKCEWFCRCISLFQFVRTASARSIQAILALTTVGSPATGTFAAPLSTSGRTRLDGCFGSIPLGEWLSLPRLEADPGVAVSPSSLDVHSRPSVLDIDDVSSAAVLE